MRSTTVYPSRSSTPQPRVVVSTLPIKQPEIPPLPSRHHTFSANLLGRDFVLGDIHGAFSMVYEGMKMVSFDPNVDRLFCVGDLIDRGPDSVRVLDFLDLPFVHAVRGNHDDDFATLKIDELRVLSTMNFNGLGWVEGVDDALILKIQARLQSLPITAEIQTERGTVGLVHADIPIGMTWQEFVAKIDSGDSEATQTALWGRDRIKSNCTTGVEGIGRVFVGHSIQFDGPVSFGNVYAIDSGAVFKELNKDYGQLNVVNIACKTSCLVNQAQVDSNGIHVIEDQQSYSFGDHVRHFNVCRG